MQESEFIQGNGVVQVVELCPHCFTVSYFEADDEDGNLFADILVCGSCDLEFENLNDQKYNDYLLEEHGEEAVKEEREFYWAAKIYK